MNEDDKIVVEHLEKMMESPELRKLLAYMLIHDEGDLTVFIRHYRLTVFEDLAGVNENWPS
jgi:hypothetical protein